MATSAEMLERMKTNERTSLLTLLEGAIAQTAGARAMLYYDEGPHGSEHHDIREELGRAQESIECVLTRVRIADARATLSAPSMPHIPVSR